jgi:hypothetical protein
MVAGVLLDCGCVGAPVSFLGDQIVVPMIETRGAVKRASCSGTVSSGVQLLDPGVWSSALSYRLPSAACGSWNVCC